MSAAAFWALTGQLTSIVCMLASLVCAVAGALARTTAALAAAVINVLLNGILLIL
jgi:hypothetical protein